MMIKTTTKLQKGIRQTKDQDMKRIDPLVHAYKRSGVPILEPCLSPTYW